MESAQDPALGCNPLDLQERPLPARVRARPGAGAALDLLERSSAVLRFRSELQRRMATAGCDGLQGLFALAERLRQALAAVSHAEIDAAAHDLARATDRMRALQDDLRELQAVKADVQAALFAHVAAAISPSSASVSSQPMQASVIDTP
ncbi:MAG: hypothetical protein B6D46_16010 [Polyangiaceae bacterium UTPRO1]|jgi:hypothetical protein|nr:hypothetical protein [Myxococcales bacterium]OQY64962.1 MAG: hypothetical protein B6D46_16010 [Polyangiaceae bacterium UTPRO1]